MSVTGEQPDFSRVEIRRAGPAEAPGMVEVIHAAFGARPALDPPSTAGDETADTVTTAVTAGAGLLVSVDGRPAGSVIIADAPDADPATAEAGVDHGRLARFQRVSVHPDFQRQGIASAMVAQAELLAAELGYRRVEIYARVELPELITYWRHRGFVERRRDPHGLWMDRVLPLRLEVPDAEAMQSLGERLAATLSGGDLVILTGALGAGKTTLTQGIGRGLDSDGAIISPTFVIARRHRSRSGRPTLVHVDAYRLGSGAELDDLGLDADVDRDITVVEWGEDLAEILAEERLEIVIERSSAGPDRRDNDQGSDDARQGQDGAELRTVWIDPVGPSWRERRLASLITTLGARS